MKLATIFASLLALFLLGSLSLTAQTDLITAEDFLALTKANDKVVVVDANKAKTYAASHLKGAININHNNLYQDGPIEGLIKSPEELAAFFGANGIGENTPVVIYDDGSQRYSTRIYWILKYIGANDVKILNKDMEAWKKFRLPLSTTPAKPAATTFTPTPQPALLATIDEVKAALDNPGVVLVDVRTPAEFNGTAENSQGHIPGAININHEELLTATGAFKPADELKAIAEANGITPDKEVIFYCRTSVRGAVAFVAFRNILGYTNVRVYDGAYLEWVANNPVVQ